MHFRWLFGTIPSIPCVAKEAGHEHGRRGDNPVPLIADDVAVVGHRFTPSVAASFANEYGENMFSVIY